MTINSKSKKDVTETILQCSILVSDTLIRMADMITLTLLYHPEMEERVERIEKLYENVINFIDDITSTIYQPVDNIQMSINQYDPVFTHLKQVAKLMAELVALLSQEHINMQLQTMEYFYNLNKSILECINVFSSLVHFNLDDIQKFEKSAITNLEIGAHKIYRMLLKDLPEEKSEWQSVFVFYLISDKMSSIVFHCCEASKKIYAARLATIGLSES